MSRLERRITFWLKTLGLIAVSIYLRVGRCNSWPRPRDRALFVGALFFAYLIFPLVRRFNRRCRWDGRSCWSTSRS
jgi:hypothetical protein